MEDFDFGIDDIGVFLMESVTKGLYRDPKNVLREYISNELDNTPKPTEINVRIEGNKIDIVGDGPGMDRAGIRTAVKVGFSPKDPQNNIGFRGIGIYSGVSICDRIAIVTKKSGDSKFYTIHINAQGLRRDIDNHRETTLIQSLTSNVKWDERTATERDKNKHGTSVSLIDILPTFETLFDKSEVRQYLENTIPLHFDPSFPNRNEIERFLQTKLQSDYRILESLKLDGNPVCRAPRLFDLEAPIFGEIKERRRVLAYYWACQNSRREKISDEHARGLLIRKKGFAVGTRPALLKLFPRSANLVDWFTGEIHVVGPDLIPNAERAELEPTHAREELERRIRKELGQELSRKARIKSATEKAQERVDEANRLPNRPNITEYDEWIDALREAETLKDNLRNDATVSFVHSSTKDKVGRAIRRVEAHLQRLKALDIRPASSPGADDEPGESAAVPPKVPSHKEIEPIPAAAPAGGAEPEPSFRARAMEEVSGMCSRSGRSDLADLTSTLFDVLIEEGLLSNFVEFRRVLAKFELKLNAE